MVGPVVGNDTRAARSDLLPLSGHAVVGTYLKSVEYNAGNVKAALQSGLVLSRGLRALRQAWTGVACMALEDAAISMRALATARFPRHSIPLFAQLCFLHTGRAAAQTTLLSTMTAQVLEDAAFPVVNRLS